MELTCYEATALHSRQVLSGIDVSNNISPMVDAKLFTASQKTILVEQSHEMKFCFQARQCCILRLLNVMILCNDHTEGLACMTSNTKSPKDRAYTCEVTPSLRQAPVQLIVVQI